MAEIYRCCRKTIKIGQFIRSQSAQVTTKNREAKNFLPNGFFFFPLIMGVRINLHVPRLIFKTLKLITIEASSSTEICVTRTDNFREVNLRFN